MELANRFGILFLIESETNIIDIRYSILSISLGIDLIMNAA